MARIGSGGDVSIRIGTDYSGAGIEGAQGGLKSLGETSASMSERMQAHAARLRANWLQIAAAVYSMKKAWDLAFSAARFKQQEQAFANLAASHGADARAIISDLKQMSAHTIATADIMESAGKAMLLSIPADKLSKMMEIARASSRITGDTVRKSFDDIAMGIGRQSKLILDNLGIIVNLDKAYRDYALAQKTTADRLSDTEKRQAFVNAVMAAGEDTIRRVGDLTWSNVEAMQATIAFLKDLSISAGYALVFVADGVIGLLAAVNSGLWKIISEALRALAWFAEKASVVPLVGKKFSGFADTLRAASKAADDTSISQAGLAAEFFMMADAIFKGTEATTSYQGSTEDLSNELDAAAKTHAVIEDRIMAVVLQTEALNASTERQIELQVLELSLAGATVDQLERYALALRLLQEAKDKTPAPEDPKSDPAGQSIDAFLDERLNAYQGYYSMLTEMSRIYSAQEMAQAMRRKDVQVYLAGETFGMMSDMMQNLTVISGKEGGAAFKAMKAFAIAETTIQTYRAAMGAYAALAPIPIVGPALATAAAAAATIAGMAKVRQIAAMEPGGSASGSTINAGGTANPAYSGGSYDAYPAPQRYDEKPTQAITIQIYNPLASQNWKEIVEDNIIPALNDAADRNISVTVRNM